MKYKKYETQAYNIHLIKTDKFKTISVKINLKKIFNKEDITFRNMLINILLDSTKDYPNRRLLEIKTEELYNLGYSGGNYNSGEYSVMSIDGSFLHEKYTEPGMNEASLQFLFDCLLRPNVIDKEFESNSFKKAYNVLKEDITSFEDNYYRYSNARMLEEMGKGDKSSYRSVGYLEDLDKITPQNLYQYYEETLRKNLIDIFIIGDIDEAQIKKIILDNFTIKTAKKATKEHFLNHTKFRRRLKTVKEEKHINQSYLSMGFKLEKLTNFEREYVGSIYSYILGGGADSKLFKNVREKNSLCYSISSSLSGISSGMIITAGISSNSFNKTVKLIKEEVKKMEKGEFDELDIEKAKITYLASLKQLVDSPFAIINLYVAHQYMGYDLLDDRTKNILMVNRDMILKLAKKVHPDTIFLLEGGSEDEKDTSL
ncbi:MAG: insulinase family protein [Bacilli bacterium]|nr:insulinase family protein [Bacilli bacterium]MDD4809127.1 insulinase family protein [Bacilli bacterium]